MTIARGVLVDRTVSGFYHCFSRCVRRAFLCGDQFEHRKDWIRDRLQELSAVFAVDVAAYAVMSNHLHVVLRTAPERVGTWSDAEAVERWSRLFPASVRAWALPSRATSPPQPRDAEEHDERTNQPSTMSLAEATSIVAQDPARVAILRGRLSDLSWFMKCLKEPVARRANREDGNNGCFWEGRFKSPRLLDDAAVLTAMVYVDLNVIRASLASTPEQSNHTSVQERIRARQRFLESFRGGHERTSLSLQAADDSLWLAPIEQSGTDGRRKGVLPMRQDEYLIVVEVTGREFSSERKGSIPPELPPILERIKLEPSVWANAWRTARKLVGTVIGSPTSRSAEALRRGTRWVVGALDMYQLA